MGRTKHTVYPRMRKYPVYLSSSGGITLPFALLERLVEAWAALSNSERYDFAERSGRWSARAALCSKGFVVEEKT